MGLENASVPRHGVTELGSISASSTPSTMLFQDSNRVKHFILEKTTCSGNGSNRHQPLDTFHTTICSHRGLMIYGHRLTHLLDDPTRVKRWHISSTAEIFHLLLYFCIRLRQSVQLRSLVYSQVITRRSILHLQSSYEPFALRLKRVSSTRLRRAQIWL